MKFTTCCFLLCSIEIARAALIIDDFNAVDRIFITAILPVTSMDVSAPSIVGGGKKIIMVKDDNLTSHSFITSSQGDGYLEYHRNQDSALFIEYGTTQLSNREMNLDLTQDGCDHFSLTITSPGPFCLALRVTDNSINRTEKNMTLTADNSGTYQIPFSSFNNVQFNAIAGIEIRMYAGYSSYNGLGVYRFEDFSAVSEPNCGCVVGIGLLGFSAYSHRKFRTISAINPEGLK